MFVFLFLFGVVLFFGIFVIYCSESAQSELMQGKYNWQMASTELDKLKEQMEELSLENEDLKIQNEMLKMDVEEARETIEDNFAAFKASLPATDQEKAEVMRLNEELQKTIEALYNSGTDLMNQKDKTIFDLTMDAGYMGTLTERVKQLLDVEREVVQLRSDIKELKDTVETLQDAERMVKQLAESNNELEGEV